MSDFINFLKTNLPFILSFISTVTAIIVPAILTHSQTKASVAMKFHEMRFEAYSAYLDAVSYFTSPDCSLYDTSALVSAYQRAIMLTPSIYSQKIKDFQIKFLHLIEALENKRATSEQVSNVRESRKQLELLLNQIMVSKDPSFNRHWFKKYF